jgi:hypothetical protein
MAAVASARGGVTAASAAVGRASATTIGASAPVRRSPTVGASAAVIGRCSATVRSSARARASAVGAARGCAVSAIGAAAGCWGAIATTAAGHRGAVSVAVRAAGGGCTVAATTVRSTSTVGRRSTAINVRGSAVRRRSRCACRVSSWTPIPGGASVAVGAAAEAVTLAGGSYWARGPGNRRIRAIVISRARGTVSVGRCIRTVAVIAHRGALGSRIHFGLRRPRHRAD